MDKCIQHGGKDRAIFPPGCGETHYSILNIIRSFG